MKDKILSDEYRGSEEKFNNSNTKNLHKPTKSVSFSSHPFLMNKSHQSKKKSADISNMNLIQAQLKTQKANFFNQKQQSSSQFLSVPQNENSFISNQTHQELDQLGTQKIDHSFIDKNDQSQSKISLKDQQDSNQTSTPNFQPRKFSVIRKGFNAIQQLSRQITDWKDKDRKKNKLSKSDQKHSKSKRNLSEGGKYLAHEDISEYDESQKGLKSDGKNQPKSNSQLEEKFSDQGSEIDDLDNLRMQLPESVVQLMLQPRREYSLKDDDKGDSNSNLKSYANLQESNKDGNQQERSFPQNQQFNDELFDENYLQKALAIVDNDFNNFIEKTQDLTVQQKVKLPLFIFSYKSKFKMYWDLIIILLALFNCLMIPIEVSFGKDFFSADAGENITIFEYFMDGWFFLDIIISFRTTYLNVSSGKEVVQSQLIAQRYVKSGALAMDIISTVPIDDLISLMIPPSSAKHLGLLGLIKMTRMLRLRKIITFMNVQQSLKVSLRMVQLVIFLLLLVHWIGCVWYMILDLQIDANRWKPVFDSEASINKDEFYQATALYQYLVVFYYSVLILIGRANEIGPVNNSQTLYASFILIMGSFVTTFIFGNIAATMENATKKDSKLSQRLSMIQSNMILIKLPVQLQDEVIKYVMQVEQAPEVQYDLNMFLDTLSPSLKAQVLNYLHQRILYSLEEFREAHEVEINFIANNLKTLLVLPNDNILQQGSSGNDMYFIVNGSVSVLIRGSASNNQVQNQDSVEVSRIKDRFSSQSSPKLKKRKKTKGQNKKRTSLSQSLNFNGISGDDSFEEENNRVSLNLKNSNFNDQIMNQNSDQGNTPLEISNQHYSLESSAIQKGAGQFNFNQNFKNQQLEDLQEHRQLLIEQQLATLTNGQYFGEIALLSMIKRTATVKAVEFSTLSSLSRLVMDTIKAEYPQIYINFKRKLQFYTDEEMEMRRKLILNIPYFKKISASLVNELIFLLRETVYDGGNLVIKHGDLSDRVHLIWKGSLKVEIYYNGKDHLFEKLNRGGCFCVFSAFSDDYTQIFDFKVSSSKAVILTLKASDMIKLAKSNLELADIVKSLEIAIKKHQKSDFDFFRFINEHPMHKSEEYRRQLRLNFQRVLCNIAANLKNKTQKMTEPLQVVQQICKERKIREQQMKMIMFKKDDYYNNNNGHNNGTGMRNKFQNSRSYFSNSSMGGNGRMMYSQSDYNTSSVQSSSVFMSRNSNLQKHIQDNDQIERDEKYMIKKIEEDQYQNRKTMIQDILNPFEVPGIDLMIFERIQGLPQDQNMFTQGMIEKYENLKARIKKQTETKDNVQFLNRLIFQQNSQIQSLKLIFDQQIKKFEQKISTLAQQYRKKEQTKKELQEIIAEEKKYDIEEFEQYKKQQEVLKQQYFQSFGQPGCHQINFNTINIKNEINNYITINSDGSFTKQTIYLNRMFEPQTSTQYFNSNFENQDLLINNTQSLQNLQSQNMLTHTEASHQNLDHLDTNFAASLADLFQQSSQTLMVNQGYAPPIIQLPDIMRNNIIVSEENQKNKQKKRKKIKLLNGEQLQSHINQYASNEVNSINLKDLNFTKGYPEQSTMIQKNNKTPLKQRHISNINTEEIQKPYIDSLYESQFMEQEQKAKEFGLEQQQNQMFNEEQNTMQQQEIVEDLSLVLSRVAVIAEKSQKAVGTPKTYQKYLKQINQKSLEKQDKQSRLINENQQFEIKRLALNEQSQTNFKNSTEDLNIIKEEGNINTNSDELFKFQENLDIEQHKIMIIETNDNFSQQDQQDLINTLDKQEKFVEQSKLNIFSSMPEIHEQSLDKINYQQQSIQQDQRFMTKRAQSKYATRQRDTFEDKKDQLQLVRLPERPQTRDRNRGDKFQLKDQSKLIWNNNKNLIFNEQNTNNYTGLSSLQNLNDSNKASANKPSKFKLGLRPSTTNNKLRHLNTFQPQQNQNIRQIDEVTTEVITDYLDFYNQLPSQNQSSTTNFNQSSAFTIQKFDKDKLVEQKPQESRFKQNVKNKKPPPKILQQIRLIDYNNQMANNQSRSTSANTRQMKNNNHHFNSRLFDERSQSLSSSARIKQKILLSEKDKERWDFYRKMIDQKK